MLKIDLNQLIPSIYNEIFYHIQNDNFSRYSIYGGRGGVKSTVEAYLLILPVFLGTGCTVAVRRYANSLKTSIFEECRSAVERLGISQYFKFTTSPLEIKCVTGYTVYFRGLDDPQKIKSLKPSKGTFKTLVFEECQEIEEESKCRSVEQTIARGGVHCNILYIFNPPNIESHWTNKVLRVAREDLFTLEVNYVDIPRIWLGEQFIAEAERLKRVDIDLFNAEYMGIVGGTKGKVFKNIHDFRADKGSFSTLLRGLDFGTAAQGDPSAYVVGFYDVVNKILYIVAEWYKRDTNYPEIARNILLENTHNFTVFCDNADNGGIKQLRIEGVKRALPCKKGKVETGIRWLRGLNAIYIDSTACPNAYREFTEYSYVLKKSTGDWVLSGKDNHIIDAVRYMLSQYIEY